MQLFFNGLYKSGYVNTWFVMCVPGYIMFPGLGISIRVYFDNIVCTQSIQTPAYVISIRKWQDYVYIQCEYKSTKQKIKHLLREENKVKENKIS